MAIYVYCIKESYLYKSFITGRSFENEWFKLSTDGTIMVKGTNKRGYSWDGCSPKWKWKEMYFGTPIPLGSPRLRLDMVGEAEIFE